MKDVAYGGTSWICPNHYKTTPCFYCKEKVKELPLIKYSLIKYSWYKVKFKEEKE